jgi:hypothetical protein
MNWRLEWRSDALDALAHCYLAADAKHEVTEHAAILERQLKQGALQVTIPVREGLRAADSGPVRLYVEIIADDQCVRIVGAALRRRRV